MAEEVTLMNFLAGMRHFFEDEARKHAGDMQLWEREIAERLRHMAELYEKQYTESAQKTRVKLGKTITGMLEVQATTYA